MRLVLILIITLNSARAGFNLSKCDLDQLSKLPDKIIGPCAEETPFFATESGARAGPSEKAENKKKIKCGSTVIAETMDVYIPADGIVFPGVQAARLLDKNMRVFEFLESCLGLKNVITYKMPSSVEDFYKGFIEVNKDLTHLTFLSDANGKNKQPDDSFAFFNFEEALEGKPATGFAFFERHKTNPFVKAPVTINLLQLIGHGFKYYLNPERRNLRIEHLQEDGVAHLFVSGSTRDPVHFKIGGELRKGGPRFYLRTEFDGLFDPKKPEHEDFFFSSCNWVHACLIVREYLAYNSEFAAAYYAQGYSLNCNSAEKECVRYQGPGKDSHTDDNITIFFPRLGGII